MSSYPDYYNSYFDLPDFDTDKRTGHITWTTVTIVVVGLPTWLAYSENSCFVLDQNALNAQQFHMNRLTAVRL